MWFRQTAFAQAARLKRLYLWEVNRTRFGHTAHSLNNCCEIRIQAKYGRNKQAVLPQETVDELTQRFETLAEPGGSGPPKKAGPTGGYDTARETGMAEPDDAAGVYSGVGSVSERDHGDAHCDSRAGSDHAESCREKCCRG